MKSNILQPLKEFVAHHRKFTQFQKVLICSIFVGVLLCVFRSWWFVFISFTYTVTVYTSVTVTKYIVICNTYFPSDVILGFYEFVCDFVRNFVDQFLKGNKKDDKPDKSVKDETIVSSLSVKEENDDEEFYDSLDSTEIHGAKDSNHTHLYSERSTLPLEESKIASEIQQIITLIQRDFVESWFKLFSKEKAVLKESEILFNHIVRSLKGRLRRTNTEKLFEFVIRMFKDHVHYVKEAKAMYNVQRKSRRKKSSVQPSIMVGSVQPSTSKVNIVHKSVEECYGAKVELHLAVKSSEAEHSYQKSVVELLLVHLLREDMHDTVPLFCALKEILTSNVLQKVMDLLSDTTFLHERIIKITSDEVVCASIESVPSITVSESDTSSKTVQSILIQRNVPKILDEHLPQTDLGSSKTETPKSEKKEVKETNEADSQVLKWKDDTEIHTVSGGLCNECNRLCSSDKDRISPRQHTCSLGKNPVFFDVSVDPDRLSLQSFNSISSSSSKESATFLLDEKQTDDIVDTQQAVINKIHDAPLNQCENGPTMKLAGYSPQKCSPSKQELVLSSSPEMCDETKSQESPNSTDNKSSNIFPLLKFPFSNPLPSFSFKRPSFKSLSPTSEMSTSTENKNDFKRSHSQGDFTPVSETMKWPGIRPSVFQDVKIASTEKAKESSGEYTLYNVEYDALYQSDTGELVYKSCTVKRRFREFVNLQIRLEDNSTYKKSLKDVKGPRKILPSLPFGNMGKDTVDSRKELLESFLASLVSKDDICNGEELKQFLGYSGDGHIAFVRKTPENTGPRIDQRLVKTMSGVFDKIVEGLPSLPQQLPRIISHFDLREERDDLPDEKLTEDTDDIDLVYQNEISKVTPLRVESVFEKFIEQQSTSLMDEDTSLDTTLGTSVLTWQDQQGTNSSHMTSTHHMTDDSSHMTQQDKNNSHSNAISHLTKTDNPLSDAVLDILIEMLQRQDHWVCRENVIKAAKVLIGKGLNRYLEEKVDFLTSSEEMNIFYLRTLRETVWPNGQLSTEDRAKYTDLQKEQIEKQAKRCLLEFLPGILKIVVGSEEIDTGLQEVMETLKYEKLNRHFWYSVFDVVLEELFPEVNTQGFQRKLSAAVQFE